MAEKLGKQECFIHSLKEGEQHKLGWATILKKVGDNEYVARYKDVFCSAIYNPFVGRFFVDDVYGIIPQERLDSTSN